ncbi:Cu(I)-responsive transcriptional regulator [Paralcaligenes ureilyticus]|uniref:Cu(I)-responsive transcriptional regulator n=1 Tax=Paralcaligenes ureilyticus TaxID=627131 RepID=A0A4V2UYE0_9BURK|nr:Cu(I)-responsive transcriptional regulator [Paralcaligenes ureilyticus]TCT07028.1 Cu(I)-responsive transcriptional regulator [Paralcaligenes ureilyticus]
MNIGQAANASGASAKKIRYYESIDLIPSRGRTDSGYRIYADKDIYILRFIRQARDVGFPIETIRLLLALWQDHDRASADVKALALQHIRELDRRLKELRAMRDTLVYLAEHCTGDDRPSCPILDGLAG